MCTLSRIFSSVVDLVTPSISSAPQIYLPFRQSKNGRKMRAANRRKQPVTTFSSGKRKGEVDKRKEEFACLDVSAPSPRFASKEGGSFTQPPSKCKTACREVTLNLFTLTQFGAKTRKKQALFFAERPCVLVLPWQSH